MPLFCQYNDNKWIELTERKTKESRIDYALLDQWNPGPRWIVMSLHERMRADYSRDLPKNWTF